MPHFYQPKRIQKILIANRGEIALRIAQAARELNIKVLAVYSDADADSHLVRLLDEAVHIGGARVNESYLNVDTLMRVARESGVDAVHPGYGFLAENADFARRVTQEGFIFIGPDADTIALMGSKQQALAKAKELGVPTIPGSGVLVSAEEATAQAQQIGYPLLLKAIAGGGGRGIRIIENEDMLRRDFPIASAEAKTFFGDGGLYLETYVGDAKHIEVQVLGDGERVVHLYDRECSLQRKRQKIMEEAPSPSISESERTELLSYALQLAQAIRYKGAGTLEFLYDLRRRKFYFMEMNTRIQVEHGVSEVLTGVDIVREMIRIADGEPLRFSQSDIVLRGASIEVRINAEDAKKNFMPNVGTIKNLQLPTGSGVRIDTLLFEGCVISHYYDSLLGKMIAFDESRAACIMKMRRLLRETRIEGVMTTLDLFRILFYEPVITEGTYTTRTLETWITQNQHKL